MSKSIKLESRMERFKTLAEAHQYYLDKSKELSSNKQNIVEGQLFIEPKEIYEKYCEYTNYPIAGKIVGFKAGPTTRKNGSQYATTTCFSVVFDNGKNIEFSIREALRAIADFQNKLI